MNHENQTQQLESLSFGRAIEAVSQGELIARVNWNGKGQFVFMRPEDTLNAKILFNAKSLPKKVKDYYERKHQPIVNEDDVQVKFSSYLCLKAVDDSIINGWIPSMSDLQAKDWFIVYI